MINVSEAFRAAMAERRDFRCGAHIVLADGTELTLGEEDFALAGNGFTDGAEADGLPLGAAVCRTASIALMNDDGHLDSYDFFGAKIRLWLTFRLEEGTERIELGTFTVLEPESWGETVTVTACDDMYRADRPYVTELDYPAALGTMFREICDGCGIPYATAGFPHDSFLAQAPPPEGTTCRQALGYIAMLAGGNARVNRAGEMEILAYDFAREPAQVLADWSRLAVDTDDALITGLETAVTGTDEEGNEVQSVLLEGEEGYVLTLENPLMAGQERQALAFLGQTLIGGRVRRFEGEHAAYPLAEFMDTVRLTDWRGRQYDSVVTDVSFTFGGFTTLADSAAAVVRNGSRYVSEAARARIAARELTQRERTGREAAVEQLQKRLAESGGLYASQEELEDGSTVYYLHDKPTLAESKNVMKLTGEAIGFSTDGGQSWPFGFTVTGEMVMGVIQAEGLSADWVQFGTFPQERIDGLEELAASLRVMQEQVAIDISRVSQSIQQTDAELRQMYEQITKYYRFTAEGLLIGDSSSELVLRLDNGRLSFLDNGAEVAYISDRTMYITDGHFLNSLRIGNFAFIPRDNGNLSFVRMD